MVTKNQIKLIKSLSQKKFRNKHGLFIVEGLKGVREFLDSSFKLQYLFSSDENFEISDEQVINVSDAELKKISFFTTPQSVLAVFSIPERKEVDLSGLNLVLDGIRDPGNLGTIIRLCDWFGIQNIICSQDTVDCYNPKVVQASMGSLSRVNICYKELNEFLSETEDIPVFGAMLEGENVYSQKLPETALLVMGNEANGISYQISALLTHKLNIPQFGKSKDTESLNVATATAILLSEFRRNSITEKQN